MARVEVKRSSETERHVFMTPSVETASFLPLVMQPLRCLLTDPSFSAHMNYYRFLLNSSTEREYGSFLYPLETQSTVPTSHDA